MLIQGIGNLQCFIKIGLRCFQECSGIYFLIRLGVLSRYTQVHPGHTQQQEEVFHNKKIIQVQKKIIAKRIKVLRFQILIKYSRYNSLRGKHIFNIFKIHE
ncbi:hypothetical protein D3C87_1656110 [compost metagenome]